MTQVISNSEFSWTTAKNDVALLKLAKPITPSDKVNTVCLPKSRRDRISPGKNCFITGKVEYSEYVFSQIFVVKTIPLFSYRERVKPWSQGWLIAAGAYPGFCSMKRLEVFLLPLDGMLVHRRSLPRNFVRFPQQIAGTHLYTWVERGTVRVKCLAQEHRCPRPGLEPGALAPESSALTMRPPRLPQGYVSC